MNRRELLGTHEFDVNERRQPHTAKSGIVAVFNGEPRILILTRSLEDSYRPGGADLPGGTLYIVSPTELEDPQVCAAREAWEEAHLNLAVERFRPVNFSFEQTSETEVYRHGYYALISEEEAVQVRLSEEHHEGAFYTETQAHELLQGHPAWIEVTQAAFRASREAHGIQAA